MKKIYFFIVIFCFFSTAHASDVMAIKNQLDKSGQAYFEEMQKSGEFDYILFLIEYGNAEAIQASIYLKTFSDAAATESIKNSLGRAINKNPIEVLKIMPGNFSENEICTIPFFEAPEDIEKIHINQAIDNLRSLKVKDKNLKTTKKNAFLCSSVSRRKDRQ